MYKFKCRHWFEKKFRDVKIKHDRKTNKSNILQILQEIHILFFTLCMMSEESTVSTAQGLIDVANVSQDFHTSNHQNDNDVMSQTEREVNSYVTQEISSLE